MSHLDKEYSPSHWSNRYATPEEVLHQHCKFIREHSQRIRSRWSPVTLAYGPDIADRLDVYAPSEPSSVRAPICVFVHGGYWQAGSREDSAFVTTRLCEVGYRVIVLGYALCPCISIQEQVKRIRMAGGFIDDYARQKGAKHISYIGHSAGAHLLACMLDSMKDTASACLASIRHVFLVSGIYDLHELRTVDAVNARNVLRLPENMVSALSPLRQQKRDNNSITVDMCSTTASENHLNIYVVVAERDSPTFQRQSREYADLMSEQSWTGSVKFEIISDCDHFDIVERLVDPDFPLTQYIVATI